MSERPSSSQENQPSISTRPKVTASKKKKKQVDPDEKKAAEELCSKLNKLVARDLEKNDNLPKSDYCCSYEAEILPRILVGNGSWEIKYPCDEDVSRKLISFASKAPIGRGSETVMDTEVRDGWHIDASQLKFITPEWITLFSDSDNSELLESIREVLTPDCKKISAKLYKMLIYEKGSFFKPHRDTQRETNHFGTIVVFLPSCYSGGELLVGHGGTIRKFQFGLEPNAGTLRAHAVSFFTDCLHEVQPTTDGYRVILTYELFYEGENAPQLPVAVTNMDQEIFNNLANFFQLSKFKDRKAGLLLQHRYALASLQPIMLKGIDRITYNAVMASNLFEVELTGVTVSASTMEHDFGCLDDNSFSKAEKYYKFSLEQNYDVDFEISRYNPRTVSKRNRVRSPSKIQQEYEAEWADKRRYFRQLDREQGRRRPNLFAALGLGGLEGLEESDESMEEEEEEVYRHWSSSSSSDDEDVNLEHFHGETLSQFTTGDLFSNEKDRKVDGPVVFVNNWKEFPILDVIHRGLESTGNTGTKFDLQYTAAALLIKQK